MPFQNESIITNKLNSTNMTGGTIYTAGTEFSIATFPTNRQIEFRQRTPVIQAVGTGTNNVEATAVSLTIPSGFLRANDSIEIYHFGYRVSGGASSKTINIRFGTAGTTSDTLISSVGVASNTTVACPTFGRVCLKSDTSFEWVSVNGYFQNVAGTYGSATTVSLSSNTYYITISGIRANVAQDAFEFKWTDVFVNRPSNAI